MRVMLVGRWAKAHALAKCIAQSRDAHLLAVMDKVNPGIESVADEISRHSLKDVGGLADLAVGRSVDYVVVSPQMTLGRGIRTLLEERDIPCFGPSAACSRLEGDKAYARNLLRRRGLSVSPGFKAFGDVASAAAYLEGLDVPVAVKPAGVTEGDGVKVMGRQLDDHADAIRYVESIFEDGVGGLASVLIEDRMRGEEFSLQAFVDGRHVTGLPLVRDYKLLEEGESGPNTPGMGSYSMPDGLLPTVDGAVYDEALSVVEEAINGLREERGELYKGLITGQFMLTGDGLRLVEFNVRAGDSEFLNLQPLLRTDFMDICAAIERGELAGMDVELDSKATVCKYVVPPGFPEPSGPVEVEVDEDALREAGCELFYSCFDNGDGEYEPSPRLIAVTGVAGSRKEAMERCESGIAMIDGEDLYHRRDIGTEKLARRYE